VLANHVMSVEPSGKFDGDALVTRRQAVIAICRLARALQGGQWHAAPSVPVPARIMPMVDAGTWKLRPIKRYTLAVVLARFGDYVANGLPHPDTGKALGKSEALPAKPKITLSAASPAYESLTYLAARRMIWPGSPLLKADSIPLHGAELSRGLSEMCTGLTDLQTDLGHDDEGSTQDRTFHKKPAALQAMPMSIPAEPIRCNCRRRAITGLRCSRCETPICPDCSVVGAVGSLCRACGSPHNRPLFQVGAGRLALAYVVCLAVGTAGGYVLFGMFRGFGFFQLRGAFLYGLAVGEVALRVTGRKRGPQMEILAGVCAAIGLFLGWAAAVGHGAIPGAALLLHFLASFMCLIDVGIACFAAVGRIRNI
jgi:hypothetical protein